MLGIIKGEWISSAHPYLLFYYFIGTEMRFLIFFILLIFYIGKIQAFSPKDAMQCVSAIAYHEKKYKIPRNILHAISLVESGLWNESLKKTMPWPWTANVQGTPYYFQSKSEAIMFVSQKLKEGIKNIDIGCNQINLQHHGHHFNSMAEVFNPHTNAEYAAKFLSQNYQQTNNWENAIGMYHSKTKELASIYLQKINKILKTSPNYAKNLAKAHIVVKPNNNPYHRYRNPYFQRRYAQHDFSSGTNAKQDSSMNEPLEKIEQITRRTLKQG